MPASIPPGGGRFRLRGLPGPPPAVAKRGDADALDREAAALRLLAGIPGVPRLLAHRPGLLVMTRLPGTPRPPAQVPSSGWRALGSALARVHGAAHRPDGGCAWWPASVTDGGEYVAGRLGDARALARQAGLGDPAVPPPPPTAGGYRPVHGDLTEGNIVWDAGAPGLVDWEFWRWGDPAEDLAYLAEANGLDDERLAAVLEGHGDAGAAARVPGWRPVVAAEIAAWWVGVGRDDLAAPLLPRPAG